MQVCLYGLEGFVGKRFQIWFDAEQFDSQQPHQEKIQPVHSPLFFNFSLPLGFLICYPAFEPRKFDAPISQHDVLERYVVVIRSHLFELIFQHYQSGLDELEDVILVELIHINLVGLPELARQHYLEFSPLLIFMVEDFINVNH